MESETILKSTDARDTFDGEGCYFTTLDPRIHSREHIAKDNWAGVWEKAVVNEKMHWVIEVYNLEPVFSVQQRDGVVIYRDDVDLNKFEHDIRLTAALEHEYGCTIFQFPTLKF